MVAPLIRKKGALFYDVMTRANARVVSHFCRRLHNRLAAAVWQETGPVFSVYRRMVEKFWEPDK